MSGSFGADLSRFAKKFDADIKTVVRKISFEAFKRIILRTPVDIGRARANWGIAAGRPVTMLIDAGDKSGAATLTTTAEGVQVWDCEGSIFMTNNLPYIGKLEYGSSTQAPQGMVRITLEEMQAWIQQNAKKATIGSLREATR